MTVLRSLGFSMLVYGIAACSFPRSLEPGTLNFAANSRVLILSYDDQGKVGLVPIEIPGVVVLAPVSPTGIFPRFSGAKEEVRSMLEETPADLLFAVKVQRYWVTSPGSAGCHRIVFRIDQFSARGKLTGRGILRTECLPAESQEQARTSLGELARWFGGQLGESVLYDSRKGWVSVEEALGANQEIPASILVGPDAPARSGSFDAARAECSRQTLSGFATGRLLAPDRARTWYSCMLAAGYFCEHRVEVISFTAFICHTEEGLGDLSLPR